MLVKLDFFSFSSHLRAENLILLGGESYWAVFRVKHIASDGKHTDHLMVRYDNLMHQTLNHILCQSNPVRALVQYLVSILILSPLLLLLICEGFKM